MGKIKLLHVSVFLIITIIFILQPAVFGTPLQNIYPMQDTNKIKKTTKNIEKIPVNRLPQYKDVQWVFAKTDLIKYCEEFKIDQLEKDLMFAKTGANSFNEFKQVRFKNGTNKRFMDVFPDKKLYEFWITARQILRDYNKTAVN